MTPSIVRSSCPTLETPAFAHYKDDYSIEQFAKVGQVIVGVAGTIGGAVSCIPTAGAGCVLSAASAAALADSISKLKDLHAGFSGNGGESG